MTVGCYVFFFFNDTATTEIYTLSLHDALPISYRDNLELICDPEVQVVHICAPNDVHAPAALAALAEGKHVVCEKPLATSAADRKSTRLNSSHANISYAVFCLKKKKKKQFSAVI